MEECFAALEALHNHPDNAVKQQANTFLMSFQVKPAAWQVIDQLLRRPDNPPYHAWWFAASALRTKLLFDFHQLEPASRTALKDSLLHHLKTFIRGPSLILDRLSICVAMLTLHLGVLPGQPDVPPGAWEDPLVFLTRALGNSPETAIALIHIVTYVPEELTNRQLTIDRHQRSRAMRMITSFGETVLKMTGSYYESAQGNAKLRDTVLQCFQSWVKYGDMPLDSLPQQPLFGAVFECLAQPDLFQTACNVITEMIRQTENMRMYPNLIRALTPRVLAIMGVYDKAVAAKDEENARESSLVVVEMAEVYLPAIVTASDPQFTMATLDSMLRISSHPDKSIATNTLHFWYMLASMVVGRSSNDDETEDAVGHQEMPTENFDRPLSPSQLKHAQLFVPYFQRLLPLVIATMAFPDNYDTLDAEEKDDLKRFRHNAAGALMDISNVIGTQAVLQTVCQNVDRECKLMASQSGHWHGLEANLHCIRAIARRVPPTEQEFMPAIMRLMTQMGGAASPLRYTATLIVGRYTDWVNQHQPTLGSLLSFVISGFNDPQIVTAACLSFKHLCDGCYRHLLAPSFFEGIMGIYKASNSLRLEGQLEVIEGTCLVVSGMDPQQVGPCLVHMISQQAEGLMKAIQARNPQETGLWLDRTAHVFRSLKVNRNQDPVSVRRGVLTVTTQLWPLLDQTIHLFKDDDRTIEKLCRCWKYAMRASEAEFGPLLKPLLELVARFYNSTPRSGFLYTLSTCVDAFSSASQYHPIFQAAFASMSAKTLSMLTSSASFTEFPDVVEDFFELGGRFLKRVPPLMLVGDILPKMCECGLQGLLVQHYESYAAILHFYECVVRLGLREDERTPVPTHSEYWKVVEALLAAHGQNLANGLFAGLNGGVPSNRVRLITPLLQTMMIAGGEMVKNFFLVALTKVVPEAPVPLKQEFMTQMCSSGDGWWSRTARSIHDLSDACRRGNKDNED